MKILTISNSDTSGGASRAAYRLHQSYLLSGLRSELLVNNKVSDDYTVHQPTSSINASISVKLEALIQRFQISRNPVLHSGNWFGSQVFKTIKYSDCDIVNVHWVNKECLSIKQIGQINKPVVMTLHDMWAFCGGEHYCEDYENSRFRLGYNSTKTTNLVKGIDLNKVVWSRKVKYWKKPFTIVTPSEWLSLCARESVLFKGWNVVTIPNALDTKVFKPINKRLARELLGLPLNNKLIGFGALRGTEDPRKGADLLFKSLNFLSGANVECVVFGQSTPKLKPITNIPMNFIGHIHDDITLALFYNAIDIMVVPSRQEAFGQTASEAQSCGTPVVAFNTTGLSDVVKHKMTGYLANPFDVNDLAYGIEYLLKNEDGIDFNGNSRNRAIKLWDYNVISEQYRDLFNSVLGR